MTGFLRKRTRSCNRHLTQFRQDRVCQNACIARMHRSMPAWYLHDCRAQLILKTPFKWNAKLFHIKWNFTWKSMHYRARLHCATHTFVLQPKLSIDNVCLGHVTFSFHHPFWVFHWFCFLKCSCKYFDSSISCTFSSPVRLVHFSVCVCSQNWFNTFRHLTTRKWQRKTQSR